MLNGVLKRGTVGTVRTCTIGSAAHPQPLTNCFEPRYGLLGNYVAESRVSRAVNFVPQGVTLAEVFDGDHCVRHGRNFELRIADCESRIGIEC